MGKRYRYETLGQFAAPKKPLRTVIAIWRMPATQGAGVCRALYWLCYCNSCFSFCSPQSTVSIRKSLSYNVLTGLLDVGALHGCQILITVTTDVTLTATVVKR